VVTSNGRLGALLLGIYTALLALSLLGILVLK
jgi:hypothetical protein